MLMRGKTEIFFLISTVFLSSRVKTLLTTGERTHDVDGDCRSRKRSGLRSALGACLARAWVFAPPGSSP